MLFMRNQLKKLRYPEPDGQGGGEPNPNKDKEKGEHKPDEKDNLSLAKAYKDLKENSVSKEEYAKLQKENQEILRSVINGEGASGSGQPSTPDKVDLDKLREELYGPKSKDLSNLEYWEKTLELRKGVIAQEGYDPFLPNGAKIQPTKQDQEKAENLVTVVEECIKEADGDTNVFTALLQGKIANDSPTFTAKLNKLGIKFK